MEQLPTYINGLLVVLLLSAFVKIVTTLSILRFAIGLQGAGFGAAVLAASLALSLVLINPRMDNAEGWQMLAGVDTQADYQKLDQSFRPYLKRYAAPELVSKFAALQTKFRAQNQPEAQKPDSSDQPAFEVLMAAFLISQLREAFQLGFIFIVPFFVIDLLVAHLLMTLGFQQVALQTVALSLKILLFFAVDGWGLVSQKLLTAYL